MNQRKSAKISVNRRSPKERHLVIGNGEVGGALYYLLKPHYQISIRDKLDDVGGFFEILHIAYPPIKNFVKIAKDYIKKYQSQLVIIHATVPVGTTRRIAPFAVHSSVRGMHAQKHHPGIVGKKIKISARGAKAANHPVHFAKSMKLFVKYFGGEQAGRAAKYFADIGFKTKLFKLPETTELSKILDTTYYGWNILFAKEAKRICDKFKLDFDEVYTSANRDYNDGYSKLGMEHVVRPVLKFVPGKIGGHCVVPNCDLLDDWLTRTIKERNKRY